MKKIALVLGALLLLIGVGVGGLSLLHQPPFDPSLYEALVSPRIARLPDQRVIEVEVEGDPNDTAGEAIGLLYRALYTVRSGRDDVEMAPPRARWPLGADTPKEQWVGRFAVPVPEAVTTLGAELSTPTARVSIATWPYGEVAEILHRGAYSAERPTIDRLEAFIAAEGYRVIGDHEEEYLKGPGWFFAGDPADYHTIIRYRVETQASDTDAAAANPAPDAEPSGAP